MFEGKYKILLNKMYQLRGLYDIRLTLKGESNESSEERIIDAIETWHGEEALDELMGLGHADLRRELKKYGIIELD